MVLKEGMYVRTIKGIDKVLLVQYAEEKRQKHPSHPSKKYWKDKIFLSKERFWRTSQNIIKASNNIIDLIEVGDYVNGVMVESVNNSIKPIPIPQYKNEYGEYVDFDESEIKSIVTKEQLESMSYEVSK